MSNSLDPGETPSYKLFAYDVMYVHIAVKGLKQLFNVGRTESPSGKQFGSQMRRRVTRRLILIQTVCKSHPRYARSLPKVTVYNLLIFYVEE